MGMFEKSELLRRGLERKGKSGRSFPLHTQEAVTIFMRFESATSVAFGTLSPFAAVRHFRLLTEVLAPWRGQRAHARHDANRTVSFGCAPNAVALDPDQGPVCHSGPE
jgi:hypothetical protein